ncbi:hypothetical protein AOLI_G00170770 [Acnodon oligacanthus]
MDLSAQCQKALREHFMPTVHPESSMQEDIRPAKPAASGPLLINEAEKDNEDDESFVDILKEEIKVAENRDNEKSKADLKDDDDEDDGQQEEERARGQMLEEKYWNILKKAKAEAAKIVYSMRNNSRAESPHDFADILLS